MDSVRQILAELALEQQLTERFKTRAESRTGYKLEIVKSNSKDCGYEIGKSYYIGYWDEVDKCVDIKEGFIYVVGKDERIRGHFTALNLTRDFIVLEGGQQ